MIPIQNYEILQILAIFVYSIVIGIGISIAFSLLNIFGMIGGLFGILIHEKKIINFPNYKIPAFIGYLVFSSISYILLFLIFFILPIFYGRYSYYDIWPLIIFAFLAIFLSVLHITAILILLTLFEYKNILTNNNYLAFTLAYFFASILLIPFFVLLVLVMFFYFSGSSIIY